MNGVSVFMKFHIRGSGFKVTFLRLTLLVGWQVLDEISNGTAPRQYMGKALGCQTQMPGRIIGGMKGSSRVHGGESMEDLMDDSWSAVL